MVHMFYRHSKIPNEVIAEAAILEASKAGAQTLYLGMLTKEFLAAVGKRENNRIYNTPVTMLPLLKQRLQADGCLESAVLELPNLPSSLWPDPCKRLQPGQSGISRETGAYNKARQKLPLTAIEPFSEYVFERLTATNNHPNTAHRRFEATLSACV